MKNLQEVKDTKKSIEKLDKKELKCAINHYKKIIENSKSLIEQNFTPKSLLEDMRKNEMILGMLQDRLEIIHENEMEIISENLINLYMNEDTKKEKQKPIKRIKKKAVVENDDYNLEDDLKYLSSVANGLMGRK